MKITSFSIAVASMLTALTTLLNIFTIVSSVQYFTVSFVYIPCVITGWFFAQIDIVRTNKLDEKDRRRLNYWAMILITFCIGFISDLLGHFISPKGSYIPFIAISSGLMPVISAVIFKSSKLDWSLKIALIFALILLICTTFLNTYGLFLIYGKGKKTFWAYLSVRLPAQISICAINYALMLLLYTPLKKALGGYVAKHNA